MRILLFLILITCMEGHSVCPSKEKKQIVIFGAGYVGLVTGSCLAQQGHRITFIETNADKVALLQSKKLPLYEPDLEELFSMGIERELINVKCLLGQELDEADLVFVAVPTPTNEAGKPQFQAVHSVLSQIAFINNRKRLVVAMRSTLLPDAFQELQKLYPQLSLVMNPEFLRESTAVKDFFHPPFCVAGGSDSEAVETVLDLYQDLTPKRYAMGGEAACLLKYACNAFHATKIAFANEIGSLCEALEIDPIKLMDVFAQDTRLNSSAAYLRPGFSFGGSCLSKDLKALLSLNEALGESSPLLEAVLPSNQIRFQRSLKAIIKANHQRLAVLGVSFKRDSDDVRDSPYLDLIDALQERGVLSSIYDPDVDFIKLKAANRELFDQRLAKLLPYVRADLESTLAGCDGVVLCKDLLAEFKNINVPVYDLEYYNLRKRNAVNEN